MAGTKVSNVVWALCSRLTSGVRDASEHGMLLGCAAELAAEREEADLVRVIPLRKSVMLNETLPRQDTALALSLVTNVTISLVHADHDYWHLGPVDD